MNFIAKRHNKYVRRADFAQSLLKSVKLERETVRWLGRSVILLETISK